jgi:hypothetical protein
MRAVCVALVASAMGVAGLLCPETVPGFPYTRCPSRVANATCTVTCDAANGAALQLEALCRLGAWEMADDCRLAICNTGRCSCGLVEGKFEVLCTLVFPGNRLPLGLPFATNSFTFAPNGFQAEIDLLPIAFLPRLTHFRVSNTRMEPTDVFSTLPRLAELVLINSAFPVFPLPVVSESLTDIEYLGIAAVTSPAPRLELDLRLLSRTRLPNLRVYQIGRAHV